VIGLAYLGALLVALGGMTLLDLRFRLAFWRRPWATAIALVLGVAFFLAWDLTGIALGVFVRGDSPGMTGLLLAPELPVEELLFLALLCYVALCAAGAPAAFRARRARAGGGGAPARGPGEGAGGAPG